MKNKMMVKAKKSCYNKSMKRKGFTIIEVALFIAITGALFIGITVGTGNSIQHQRFYDTTQNFAEFLRTVYSEVSNPQSVGDGRSEEAIYGKLVTFGETVGLDGREISRYDDAAQRIFVYDVVGNVIGMGTGSAQKLLADVGANAVRVTRWDGSRPRQVEPAGETIVFSPRWGASIETTEILTTEEKKTGKNNLFTGSILVVRHPRSGTINTLVSPVVIEVNKTVAEANQAMNAGGTYDFSNLLTRYLGSSASAAEKFVNREVDFCINQYGDMVGTDYRFDVRIVNNARNSSGVEVIDLDSSDNKCRYN